MLNIILIYIGFCAFMFLVQRSFIYHPRTFENYDDATLKQINAVKVSQDDLEWLYLPSPTPSNKILIYFHGNAGAAIDRVGKALPWRQNGFNVVLAEYPAYGTNGGKVSEQSFYDAGRIIINKTLSDFPNAALYFYGESIGSGTAVQMASEYNEKAIIVESGFSSLTNVAFSKMPFIPVSLLLRDKFDNISKINDMNSRLIWLHGAQDKIVPMRFGQALFDAYKGEKDFQIFDDAGHNAIYIKTDMNAVIRDLKL